MLEAAKKRLAMFKAWEKDNEIVQSLGRLDEAYELGFHAGYNAAQTTKQDK